MNEGVIANAAEIFELKKGDLQPLERFAEKSAQNLLEAIENSRQIDLEKFLFALGIRHVGEETGVLITRNLELVTQCKIKNMSGIIKYFPAIATEDWLKIKGIGEKSAESLVSWFNEKNNLQLLEKMKVLGVEVRVPVGEKQETGKLEGKTFVLTGELRSFTRDEAKDIIRKAGGDISSSVSKKTDYVVAGENPGSKHDKAKALGVRIIDENEFKDLIK